MITIGIYGLMGTGKTTVVSYLVTHHGFLKIRADDISKEVLNYPEVEDFIKRHFPHAINAYGTIDRTRLRKYIFNSRRNNMKLGAIMWPLIRNRIIEIIELSNADKIVIEAANLPLLKVSFDYYMYIINSDSKILTKRLKRRDIRDELEIKRIMNFQKDVILNNENNFKERSILIDNNSTLEEFFKNIDNALDGIYLDYLAEHPEKSKNKAFEIPMPLFEETKMPNFLEELQPDELEKALSKIDRNAKKIRENKNKNNSNSANI
ncbi:dephospho-CoA kinase [Spiroplasma endosymbiont of Labia minor]|uniref:dephospho-CoA kinase n=1 Tax=Spiroplasma endosymbiont of Labia minor TaxID=3066305 RepID=UPI0030D4DFC7